MNNHFGRSAGKSALCLAVAGALAVGQLPDLAQAQQNPQPSQNQNQKKGPPAKAAPKAPSPPAAKSPPPPPPKAPPPVTKSPPPPPPKAPPPVTKSPPPPPPKAPPPVTKSPPPPPPKAPPPVAPKAPPPPPPKGPPAKQFQAPPPPPPGIGPRPAPKQQQPLLQQPPQQPPQRPSGVRPVPPPPPPPAVQAPRGPGQPVRPDARRLDDLRNLRQQQQVGGRTIIREPGRTIIRDGNRVIIRNDDADRFRRLSRDVQVVRRGANTETVILRPDGSRIIDVVDGNGRLIRRVRRDARGRDFVIIDSRPRGPASVLPFVTLAPPVLRIPRDRYIVESDRANGALLYETLTAPPVERIDRAYTLDEIRYSAGLRDRMRRVDIDTITFDTGSWEITPDQAPALQAIAQAMLQAIQRNPRTVFLIEGHTDAVGQDVDNLSLSDRRAQSVAELLTTQFGVPPENLVTQGYGEQYLKIPTQGPERRNRRVSVRNITPLMGQAVAPQQPQGEPPPPDNMPPGQEPPPDNEPPPR